MKGRGDNCRQLSRIAASMRSGWTPSSSQKGFAARAEPPKPSKPDVRIDHGPGYRKADGIRSWRAE